MGAAQHQAAPSVLWINALKVWLTNRLVDAILKQAVLMAPLETGGALVGWRNEGELVVTGLIGPGPLAQHQEFSFYPDHHWQVARLEEAYRETGGDLDYVGDWHTHPAGRARMSVKDRRTLARLPTSGRTSIMLIAGLGDQQTELGCWTASRTGSLLARLRPNIRNRPVHIFDRPNNWPECIRIA